MSATKAHAKMGVNVQINMENTSAPVLQVGLEKTVKLVSFQSAGYLPLQLS